MGCQELPGHLHLVPGQRVVPRPTPRTQTWSRTRILVREPSLAVLGLVLLPHVRRLISHRVRPRRSRAALQVGHCRVGRAKGGHGRLPCRASPAAWTRPSSAALPAAGVRVRTGGWDAAGHHLPLKVPQVLRVRREQRVKVLLHLLHDQALQSIKEILKCSPSISRLPSALVTSFHSQNFARMQNISGA